MNNKYILIIISLIICSTFLISAYDCNLRTEDIVVSSNNVFFSLVLINSTGGMIPNSPQVIINSSCYDEDGNSISSPTLTSVGDGKWQGSLTTIIPGVCHFNATNSGIVCAGNNAMWSMLTGEINTTVEEINTTVYQIYNLLVDDLNVTLTTILNLTDLTYLKIVDIESAINDLDTDLSSLKTYLEGKRENEDANKIYDKIKDIRSDVTYLKSRYYYTSEEEKRDILLSIREDSREILDLVYGQEKWWEGILIWIVPILFILIIIIISIALSKRKSKDSKYEFGGEMNE